MSILSTFKNKLVKLSSNLLNENKIHFIEALNEVPVNPFIGQLVCVNNIILHYTTQYKWIPLSESTTLLDEILIQNVSEVIIPYKYSDVKEFFILDSDTNIKYIIIEDELSTSFKFNTEISGKLLVYSCVSHETFNLDISENIIGDWNEPRLAYFEDGTIKPISSFLNTTTQILNLDDYDFQINVPLEIAVSPLNIHSDDHYLYHTILIRNSNKVVYKINRRIDSNNRLYISPKELSNFVSFNSTYRVTVSTVTVNTGVGFESNALLLTTKQFKPVSTPHITTILGGDINENKISKTAIFVTSKNVVGNINGLLKTEVFVKNLQTGVEVSKEIPINKNFDFCIFSIEDLVEIGSEYELYFVYHIDYLNTQLSYNKILELKSEIYTYQVLNNPVDIMQLSGFKTPFINITDVFISNYNNKILFVGFIEYSSNLHIMLYDVDDGIFDDVYNFNDLDILSDFSKNQIFIKDNILSIYTRSNLYQLDLNILESSVIESINTSYMLVNTHNNNILEISNDDSTDIKIDEVVYNLSEYISDEIKYINVNNSTYIANKFLDLLENRYKVFIYKIDNNLIEFIDLIESLESDNIELFDIDENIFLNCGVNFYRITDKANKIEFPEIRVDRLVKVNRINIILSFLTSNYINSYRIL